MTKTLLLWMYEYERVLCIIGNEGRGRLQVSNKAEKYGLSFCYDRQYSGADKLLGFSGKMEIQNTPKTYTNENMYFFVIFFFFIA